MLLSRSGQHPWCACIALRARRGVLGCTLRSILLLAFCLPLSWQRLRLLQVLHGGLLAGAISQKVRPCCWPALLLPPGYRLSLHVSILLGFLRCTILLLLPLWLLPLLARLRLLRLLLLVSCRCAPGLKSIFCLFWTLRLLPLQAAAIHAAGA